MDRAMILTYCYGNGEWTKGPCSTPGCEADHVDVEIDDDRKDDTIILFLETMWATYSRCIDGDNPLPWIAEAWRKVTGKEIE